MNESRPPRRTEHEIFLDPADLGSERLENRNFT
jgi:hypothetical protein